MKVEEKLKELGFENSSFYPNQWWNNQLDVLVYTDSKGKITDVQICKSWHLNIKSNSIYCNYSTRNAYLVKVIRLLKEISDML